MHGEERVRDRQRLLLHHRDGRRRARGEAAQHGAMRGERAVHAGLVAGVDLLQQCEPRLVVDEVAMQGSDPRLAVDQGEGRGDRAGAGAPYCPPSTVSIKMNGNWPSEKKYGPSWYIGRCV